LEILRNKRIQAKQWLEKFGKSISATTSSRHTRKSEGRAGANGGLPLMNVSLGEKINLDDMKKMVQQGEQLCEERKSKELTRAMNVLDTAEEVQLDLFSPPSLPFSPPPISSSIGIAPSLPPVD
jgi:tryptophanyl-tRNA synthetase